MCFFNNVNQFVKKKKKLKNLPKKSWGHNSEPPLISTGSELFWSLGTQ